MKLDLTSLRRAYADGSLTVRGLVASIHERIQACDNPAIWIHVMDADALEPFLKRLEAADPRSLPLYGVPFAIKDNIDLAGVPTTAACPAFAYTPGVSAPVVERLIRAGAIPIGKTNLDQFATGLVGLRSPYGAPRNPLAPDRVPGGSSSGSAVALSEGLASFSLGTDTAGSGRVPAAFNRLWGVKPSRGRLSTRGVVPACRSLDCVSIFALNAADSLAVLGVAEGYDAEDAYSQPLKDRPIFRSRKLGVPRPEQLVFFGDSGSTPWLGSGPSLMLREKVGSWWSIDFASFLEAARLLYEGPWSRSVTPLWRTFKRKARGFLFGHPEPSFPAGRGPPRAERLRRAIPGWRSCAGPPRRPGRGWRRS